MPIEVSQFLVTRVHIWCNMSSLFWSNLKCKKSYEGWKYIQHYNPFTSHRESTGTSTNMSVTPRGICTVTLPAMTGQPAPIICAVVAHLSSLPLPVIFWSSSKTESLSQAAVLQVLPHYLSMATAATEKPVHLLRKWKEATNVSSHNIPLFPPYFIFFLK